MRHSKIGSPKPTTPHPTSSITINSFYKLALLNNQQLTNLSVIIQDVVEFSHLLDIKVDSIRRFLNILIFYPPTSPKHLTAPSSSQPPHPPPPPKINVPQPSPEHSPHPFTASLLPSPKLPPSPSTSPSMHSSSSQATPLSKPKPSALSPSTPIIILNSPSPLSSPHQVPSKLSSLVSSSHTIPLNLTTSPQPTSPTKPIHISLSPPLRTFKKKIPIRRKPHSTITSPSPPILTFVLFPTVHVFPSTMPSSTTSSSTYKPPSTTDFASTPPHLTPPTLSPSLIHSIPPDPSLDPSDPYYPPKRWAIVPYVSFNPLAIQDRYDQLREHIHASLSSSSEDSRASQTSQV